MANAGRARAVRTYEHDVTHCDGLGDVQDAALLDDAIKAQGGKILREAGPMNAGTTIIAFVEDPDGNPIELIGKKH